jgi:hypothetical protein
MVVQDEQQEYESPRWSLLAKQEKRRSKKDVNFVTKNDIKC